MPNGLYGCTTLLQKLFWAKALPYNNLNCHGLKPAAIESVSSRDFSPILCKVSHTRLY
jgi:hypothetical protein